MTSLHVHSKPDHWRKQISLNIVPYFAIKWLKYTRNKGILSIHIMGKIIFVLFWNFFAFDWRAKLVIYFFIFILFLFYLTRHLRYATYGLETCCSYLGSIKHFHGQANYFHIVASAVFFLFSFCPVGHNIEF